MSVRSMVRGRGGAAEAEDICIELRQLSAFCLGVQKGTTTLASFATNLLHVHPHYNYTRAPCGARRAMSIKWNEANLQANEEEATAANRMQITEPKTPFHYLGDDGEPEAYPPKAAAATAAPREAKPAASQQLQPGMDLSKLASAALERREEQPEPEDEPEGATTRRICVPAPPPTLTRHALTRRQKAQVRPAQEGALPDGRLGGAAGAGGGGYG